MGMPTAGNGPGPGYPSVFSDSQRNPPAYQPSQVESSKKSGYPQQQAFTHGHPQQQSYSNQGYPHQSYPNQGYPPAQSPQYPPQNSSKNYPNQGYPNQCGNPYQDVNMKQGKKKETVNIPIFGKVKKDNIKKGAGALAAGYAAKKM